MQVVILCGGRGTRLGSESRIRPKPLVEIGEKPILWHIMKYYAMAGHKDFALCLGHKGEMIKDYFLDYEIIENDVVVELGGGGTRTQLSCHSEEGWRVVLANTGREANTGTRVKRIERYIQGDEFMLTYGDGVSDVNLDEILAFHRSHGRLATVTAVHPPARFGELIVSDEGRVTVFAEKPQTSRGLISGGFFVMKRGVFEYLNDDDTCSLEVDALVRLAQEQQLMAFTHDGFWQCVDTVRELTVLRHLWDSGHAPWRKW